MRRIELWLASALTAALLVLAGATVAQPPKPKDGPSKRKDGPSRVFIEPGRLGVDDVVEHILSFDKNKDGKVSKDELPERMQGLIAKGDTNKDGALDKDEIKKLATNAGGPGRRIEFGLGRGGIEGPGPGGPGPGGIEGAVIEGVVD